MCTRWFREDVNTHGGDAKDMFEAMTARRVRLDVFLRSTGSDLRKAILREALCDLVGVGLHLSFDED